MEKLYDLSSHVFNGGLTGFTKNNRDFSRDDSMSDAHQKFEDKLNVVSDKCAVDHVNHSEKPKVQQSMQQASGEGKPSSKGDLVLNSLGVSPQRLANNNVASKAAAAIARHDGTGANAAKYRNDAQIGFLELARTSRITGAVSLGLRSIGDGNGFLNKKELEQAQRDGLIIINQNGLISLTKKGEIKFSEDPKSVDPLNPPNTTGNKPGFIGNGLNGDKLYPDIDGDGDCDVVIYVDNNTDLDALKKANNTLEVASGGRFDFQIVTGASRQVADQNKGIWLEVRPGTEFAENTLGVAGGNKIKIRDGYESELQILLHELMHTLDMNHADGDHVLSAFAGPGVITDLSPLEVANLLKSAQDYTPGKNNQPNSPVDYAQWQDSWEKALEKL